MSRKAASNNDYFSTNLRQLCATKPSVSAVCRDVGLNRQQFERYLTGAAMPSAHNLRRLCAYFAVEESQLLAPPSTTPSPARPPETAGDPSAFAQALRMQPDELPQLRHYCGSYQYHFLSPTWPGKIQTSVLQIYESERRILSRYLGRVRDPKFGTVMRSRFNGQLVLRSGRIFVMECSRDVVDSFAQTILFPAHRHSANYLTGMAFGIGWLPHRGPFASHVILRRLRPTQSMREAVAHCGLYAPDSRALDPIVRKFFGEDALPYVSEHL
ncbi:helix-turn-helix transcriptional regulator [Xinfangfangia sp. CPCC 101601]|uniref:Helix-turn-helix transcriptional regulator n=1 Tax=Pseudogemmobacter lacusdianii TaxID=3069608 RepID=A0ABU0VTS3_9RHOB|nr:helix-turn-helix transcriptional regulator [Xinfangfangia sp. CPCC 101601]MDQ2065131.1 helix-turn-helix transcriptional regulator [Xinfangfangia sp. CPCC 101601]